VNCDSHRSESILYIIVHMTSITLLT